MSIQPHARTVAALLPQTAQSANGAGNPASVAHSDRQMLAGRPARGTTSRRART